MEAGKVQIEKVERLKKMEEQQWHGSQSRGLK
jgi:hypothetical protein